MSLPRDRAPLAALLGLCCSLAAPARRAGAEEFIYLGAGPILGDRARQMRTTASPGVGWQSPDVDDTSWATPEAMAAAASPAPVAPGLAPTTPAPATSADGGAPAPPACTGTLYLRRRFDVGPELSRLASLALRIRYED